MKMLRSLLVAGIGLCFSGVMASAVPVSVGTWYNFSFGETDSALNAGGALGVGINPDTTLAPAAPWEFTLINPGILFVTDFFISGDEFELFDATLGSLGMTSDATEGTICDVDISCAIADLAFSRRTFSLAAGTYSISGFVRTSPFTGGAGAFQVSEVPIPAALPLLASTLGALGYAGWRKRRKAAPVAA